MLLKKKKPYNAVLYVPNPSDVTSLYRAMGPFYEMIRNGEEHVHVTLNPPLDFIIASQYHFAFFQRPENESQWNAMKILKRSGVKIWVDYDDLLLAVPDDNPGYAKWAKREVKQAVIKCIQEADLVTVSTTQLKRVLSQFNDRIYVVPNAWSEHAYGARATVNPRSEDINLVNWRGSATHEKDIMEYCQEIAEAVNESENYKVQFIGYLPWFMSPMVENRMIYVEELHPERYFDFINRLQPKVHVVPLFDSLFNRCKSNIAQIEALFSRAIPVCPDWPEWRRIPGSLLYGDQKEFKECLKRAMSMSKEEREDRVSSGWNYVVHDLSLRAVNAFREVLMKALINGYPWPGHVYEIEIMPEDDRTESFVGIQEKTDKGTKSIRHENLQAIMT